MTRTQEYVKSGADWTAAAVGLVVVLPVLVVAAVWIKLVSTGPVLFVQQRIGKNGRPFRIYKFRTMHLAATTHRLGSCTVMNDPRLFVGARWLRKFKIDELPQLLNVLEGRMSLVGPRPTVAEDYRRMTRRQQQRAAVKPGLTGLAQIRGRAALLWPERIEIDLQYIQDYRLLLDLKILAVTCWLVAAGGADVNPVDGDEWGDASTAPLEVRRAA